MLREEGEKTETGIIWNMSLVEQEDGSQTFALCPRLESFLIFLVPGLELIALLIVLDWSFAVKYPCLRCGESGYYQILLFHVPIGDILILDLFQRFAPKAHPAPCPYFGAHWQSGCAVLSRS